MHKKCYRCFYSVKTCFCNEIIPIKTNIKVVILIHPKEADKQKTGTGRLTHLSLQNSELIKGINFTNNIRVNELINNPCYFPALLYPSNTAVYCNNAVLKKNMKNKKLLIIILDGTWWDAKIMLRESKNLQKLTHITFKNKYISKYHFKKQPKSNFLSTIESAYYLLNNLKKNNISNQNADYNQLMSNFKKLIQTQTSFHPGIDKNAIYKKMSTFII